MKSRENRAVAREVRALYVSGVSGDLTDGQLLERFATRRGEASEAAFSVLLARHGPMVWRVCRSVLPHSHDAQDAFQATFLVLVRKARGLWVRDSLGPWLHQVALRTAAGARAATARRRRLEASASERLREGSETAESVDELSRVLHEELGRLPERYRVPVVLCDLGGRTHEQAARHLGLPVGTVKSRLARARDRLRDRMVRRGFAPGLVVPALAGRSPEWTLSPAMIEAATASASSCLATGLLDSGSAALLAKGVLQAMSIQRWFKLAAMFLVAGATASGPPLLAQKEGSAEAAKTAPAKEEPGQRTEAVADGTRVSVAPPAGMGTHTVGRERLLYTIKERGSLEPSRSEDVYSQVAVNTTILRILPEGTRVKKGDLVCELDSLALRDQLTNQIITSRGAEATYQTARSEREVAEIALTEYLEGTSRSELLQVTSAVAAAQERGKVMIRRLERLGRARAAMDEVRKKSSAPPTTAEILADLDLADRFEDAEEAVRDAKAASELEYRKRDTLEKFTMPRTVASLKGVVERARAREFAARAAWELERSKEEKIQRQITNCKLLAPSDGVIVYANDPNRFTSNPQIEEGATVRERQRIFSVPDLSEFRVNAKVHEAVVDRVTPGQKARITVDAYPGEVFMGKVESVAPLPDPTSYFNQDVKVYTTKVKIEGPIPALRPGMTALAEITTADRPDVLSVPVSAVIRFGGKDRVAVKTADGGFVWKAVTLGQLGNLNFEVKSGLSAGEVVGLDPKALLSPAERDRFLGPEGPTTSGLMQKLRGMTPQLRSRLRSNDLSEREAALREAGLNQTEIDQFLTGIRNPSATSDEASADAAAIAKLLQKLRGLSPDQRVRLRSADPAERAGALREAGFTEAEIELHAKLARQPSRSSGDVAPKK
ncbi:MAG: efflux RND transporter periplasmic adaptor subunit [Isosphaeraceae bacterium]